MTAELEPLPENDKKSKRQAFLASGCSKLLSDSGEQLEEENFDFEALRSEWGIRVLLLSTRFLNSAGPTITEPGTG